MVYNLEAISNGGHSFEQQIALAKAEATYKKQGAAIVPHTDMWHDHPEDPNPSAFGPSPHATGGVDSMETLQNTLRDPDFDDFVKKSYSAESGYSIRINPLTGKKEMMVAGTRHNMQWVLNAYDTGLYGGDKVLKVVGNGLLEGIVGAIKEEVPFLDFFPTPHIKKVKILEHLDPWRKNKEKYYQKIARDQQVDVIYGHSRGGALVADMSVPGAQKVGLDAAMLLAHNTGMKNINEGGGYNPMGLFDGALGLTGKDNVHFDASTWSPHKVWST